MIKQNISVLLAQYKKSINKFKYNAFFGLVQFLKFAKEEYALNYKINFEPIYTFAKNLFKLVFKYKLKRKLRLRTKLKVASIFLYLLFIIFYVFCLYSLINDNYFFTGDLLRWFIVFEKNWEFLGHQSRYGLSSEETIRTALGADHIERHSSTLY